MAGFCRIVAISSIADVACVFSIHSCCSRCHHRAGPFPGGLPGAWRASALSPIACGAGTICHVLGIWLGECCSSGASQGGEDSLSRSNLQNDFFISITGGIIGLSAPGWLSRMSLPLTILLLAGVACAIVAAGWLMAQPAKAARTPDPSRRRVVAGALTGAAMGAGIRLVRLIFIRLELTLFANSILPLSPPSR